MKTDLEGQIKELKTDLEVQIKDLRSDMDKKFSKTVFQLGTLMIALFTIATSILSLVILKH